MHIRPAQIKDIPDIIRLGRLLLELHSQFDNSYYQLEQNFDGLFEKWVIGCLNNSSQFIFVAETTAPDKIAGFISGFIKPLYPWFRVKSVGHITYMIVDSIDRRKGAGKELETAAVNWFKSKNIPYLELYVDEKNNLGQNVWNACNYLPFKKFLRKKLY